jgi:hypothetical protein
MGWCRHLYSQSRFTDRSQETFDLRHESPMQLLRYLRPVRSEELSRNSKRRLSVETEQYKTRPEALTTRYNVTNSCWIHQNQIVEAGDDQLSQIFLRLCAALLARTTANDKQR